MAVFCQYLLCMTLFTMSVIHHMPSVMLAGGWSLMGPLGMTQDTCGRVPFPRSQKRSSRGTIFCVYAGSVYELFFASSGFQ